MDLTKPGCFRHTSQEGDYLKDWFTRRRALKDDAFEEIE